MRAALLFLVGLFSASCLPAQTSLSGPVEAFTFDAPTRSLRAVIGFPGAASFGPALMDNLDLASVAPGQNYGIIFERGKCLLVSGLNAKTVSQAEMAGVSARPDGVVWSANGSLAVLYSRAGNWFQTISGLPDAPLAGTVVDVSSLGSLTAVAVDGPGKQIAVGVSGDKGGVYQATANWVAPLASMGRPISLCFSSDAETVYALDSATLQVTAVNLASHGFQTQALEEIQNPIAIRVGEDSENRPVLYVAGGRDRVLQNLDLASRQVLSELALHFEPTSLDAFGNNSFVLAYRSQSVNPLWLYSSTPLPGAYFVPAVQLRQPDSRLAGAAGRTR
ncbi:MAG: YncE family protein [Bryobacteraceae bacterium]